MKKFGNIIGIVSMILKYTAVISAFVKALTVLKDELKGIEKDEE